MARRTALKLADPRHNTIFGRTIAIWGRAYAAALRIKSRRGMRASIFPGFDKGEGVRGVRFAEGQRHVLGKRALDVPIGGKIASLHLMLWFSFSCSGNRGGAHSQPRQAARRTSRSETKLN